MPAAEAAKLLTRHRWHEGDVELLQAVAARLGVQGAWGSRLKPVVGLPGAAAGGLLVPGGRGGSSTC